MPKSTRKIGDANLGMDHPVLGLERPLHGVLERRFGVAAGRREGFGDGTRAVLGEFEKVLEVDDAARVRPAEIDLLGVHAREDDHLAPRAGDRDVEPAMAALVVERGNLRGDAPGLVGADRQEKMMTSRSSPCTFSMFLTKTGSGICLLPKRSRDGSAARSWSSMSSISRCCSPLNVTMPIDSLGRS